ncbi:hypothetical protein [Mucilaginibacter sp.]
MENSNQLHEHYHNTNLPGHEDELNYWSEEFGIAKEELVSVFKHGGTFSAAVEAYVKKLKFAI